MKELLIIFAKNPRMGKVKTRLATSIGNEKALRIYEILLRHTLRITQNYTGEKAVYYSDFIPANDDWKKNGYHQFLQHGNDLGEKMAQAFRSAFIRGYDKVILIGSDCYEITEKEIELAFEKLSDFNMVIGPATDGGYYLIGLTQPVPQVFQNKNWGTETVLEGTLKDAEALSVSVHQLQVLSDIDDLNDLLKYDDLFSLI